MKAIPHLAALGLLLAACLLSAFPASASHLKGFHLTDEERRWLANNPDRLTVIYDPDFRPIEYTDENGNFAGMGADVLALVEKRLGVRFTAIRSQSWSEAQARLASGEGALATCIAETPERRRFASFTHPYAELSAVILTTRRHEKPLTLDDLAGQRVAVTKDYVLEEFLREKSQGRFEIVPMTNIQQGLRDLSLGLVDAMVEFIAPASFYIEQDGLSNLRVAGSSGLHLQMSFAVSNRYPLLFSAVSKALHDIPAEELSDIYQRRIKLKEVGLFSATLLRQLKLYGVFVVVLLVSLAIMNWLLKRKLNEKMARLKQTERELLYESERLQLAQESTNAAIWDYYPQTDRLYLGAKWFALLGLGTGKILSSLENWLESLHPDDAETARKALADYLKQGGQGAYAVEFRVRGPNGEWKWILSKGQAVARDQHGRPTRLIGLHVDIDALRSARQSLAASENLLRAFFEQTFQLSGLLDIQGDILRLNKTALDFFGLTPEQAAGMPYGEGPWWPDATEAKELIGVALRLIHQREVFRQETVFKDASGELRAIDLSLSPFVDNEGKVLYIIAEGRDITEMKRAQQAVADSEQRFRTIFERAPIAVFLTTLEDGRFLDVNETFLRSLGLSRAEALRLTTADVFDGFAPVREEIVERLRRDRVLRDYAVDIPGPDGEIMHLLCYSNLVTLAGTKRVLTMALDVTAQRKAQEALKASEARYRSVIENIQDVYYRTDSLHRLVMVSPSGVRLLGYDSESEVLGRPNESFWFEPEGRKAFLEELRTHKKVHDYELQLRRKDGQPVHVSTSSSLYYDAAGNILGVEGIFRDITERKATELRLKQSEEKFSTIFAQAPMCFAIVRSSDTAYLDVNAAFEQFSGYTRAEVQGKTSIELGLWANPGRRTEYYELLTQNGFCVDFPFEFRKKDGTLRQCLITGRAVVIAQEPCTLHLFRDVTDQLLMQQAMIQSEKMVSIGGIAAGIAHEINNPLGIILQAAQNLTQRLRPDFRKNIDVATGLNLDLGLMDAYLKARKIDEFLTDIQSAAVRASGIIRHMLDFSRRSESRRMVCDIRSIIGNALSLAGNDYDLKKSYDFKRIEITTAFADTLPPVSCTETEIEQVILNLLRNAAQAMAASSPAPRAPRIDIRVTGDAEWLRIEVEDNGGGIPKEVQARIFEPFFTTKGPGVGTGLGLSVSYFIVTKGHGGRMSVRSEPGRNTVFIVELPSDPALADTGGQLPPGGAA